MHTSGSREAGGGVIIIETGKERSNKRLRQGASRSFEPGQ